MTIIQEYIALAETMLEARRRHDDAAEEKAMEGLDELWGRATQLERDEINRITKDRLATTWSIHFTEQPTDGSVKIEATVFADSHEDYVEIQSALKEKERP